jgi:hypothetical protein
LRIVLASRTEGRESAARSSQAEALKQRVDIVGAEAGREDASERFLEGVCAGDLAAVSFERGERGGLLVGEVLGTFEQRPAGVFEALGGGLGARG